MRKFVSVKLEHLTPEERLVLVEKAAAMAYAAGDEILAQGGQNDKLFVVSEGKVRLERDLPVKARYVATSIGVFREKENGNGNDRSRVVIAVLGPGAIFGALSFIDYEPASATAIAETDVEVLVLEREQLETWCLEAPDFAARLYRSIAKVLSHRLRNTERHMT